MALGTICTFPEHVRMWVHAGVNLLIRDQRGVDSYVKRLQDEGMTIVRKTGGRFNGTREEFETLVYKRIMPEFCLMTEAELGIPMREDAITYNKTLDYIEENILQNPLKNLSKQELENLIKSIHDQELSPSHPNYNSDVKAYRKEGVIINRIKEVAIGDIDSLIAHVKKHAPEEDPQLKEFLAQSVKGIPVDKMRYSASEEMTRFIDKYCKTTPPPEEVPRLMEEFVAELLLRLRSNEDPISIAVFTFHRLVEIHPYRDGNGRLARIFMNIILMQGGHQPIAFALDSEYKKAIIEDQMGHAGVFEKFIRSKVAQFDFEALPLDLLAARARIQELWKQIQNYTFS